jgi:hypothetical protein
VQLDEYDMMVRELGFEMKAAPSEKLKTPEELAREERERLQRLEVRTHCVTGGGHGYCPPGLAGWTGGRGVCLFVWELSSLI